MTRFIHRMTLRVEIGQALGLSIAVCLLTVFAGVAEAQRQKPRVFSRADYETYFKPGRFATYSPFYQSDGVMDVVGNKVTGAAGQYLLEQSTKSFDVSPNYDFTSAYPFYKIQTQHTELMVWDARQGLYRYDYTAAEFGVDKARVWESNDQALKISPADKGGGDLHQFYRDADRRAGQNPKTMEDDFKTTIVGQWTLTCSFIRDDRFEVECNAKHLRSEHVETFFYRRLDELTS
ncbi:MAG: hypothetical protein Q8R02_01545 [Hyphomonadaceae bacterium]|nr:hypothetical protein [Hyphomonadaceae bacterium]